MDGIALALAAAEAFRMIDKEIGAQTVSVLLTIAQNDGRIMVSDLERMCGLTRESASRNVTRLGTKQMRDGRPGLGFVETKENPTDYRVKMLFLTRSGHAMVNKIASALEAHKGKR